MKKDNEHIGPLEGLIEENTYEGDQSKEFDELIRSNKATYARMKDQSEATKDKLVVSEWHVPCHCILTQTKDRTTQAFHVQPNQLSYTLLSHKQEKTLENIGVIEGSQVIVAFSNRSWFGNADRKELCKMGFGHVREIPVDTDQWWRIVYNPLTNEIWIDDKIHNKLFKYTGFSWPEKDEGKDVHIETAKIRKLLSQAIPDKHL